jgi:hypothetical protein
VDDTRRPDAGARSFGAVSGAVLLANLGVVAVAVAVGSTPAAEFGEHGFVTTVSFAVLLAGAGLAVLVFRSRRAAEPLPRSWRAPECVWLVVAAALVFLAVDEVGKVHENLDKWLHRHMLGHAPTALTDLLDDAILGLYGVGAVAVCIYYRAELLRDLRVILFFVAAIGLLFVDVALDVVAQPETLEALVPERAVRRALRTWLPVVEESTKLLAESAFGLGLYAAWQGATQRALALARQGGRVAPAPIGAVSLPAAAWADAGRGGSGDLPSPEH